MWWWRADTEAQRMVAAYIDLNPVRAGLVKDPADYGFSGFGEACAGGSAARRGIARIEGKLVWSTKSYERYRARLCSRMGPALRPPRGGGNPSQRRRRAKMSQKPAWPKDPGFFRKSVPSVRAVWWGRFAWVESFCARQWLAGFFQKGRKAQAVVPDSGGDLNLVTSIVKRPRESPL